MGTRRRRIGQVAGERVRSFAVGSQTEGCVADDDLGPAFPPECSWPQDGADDDGAQNFTMVPFDEVFPG